jgi:hypothetical protein
MNKWFTILRLRVPYIALWAMPATFIIAFVFTGPTRLLVLRWLFFVGFMFQVWVGTWAFISITRMQHEQAIAITMLRALAERSGLKEAIEKLTDQQKNGAKK